MLTEDVEERAPAKLDLREADLHEARSLRAHDATSAVDHEERDRQRSGAACDGGRALSSLLWSLAAKRVRLVSHGNRDSATTVPARVRADRAHRSAQCGPRAAGSPRDDRHTEERIVDEGHVITAAGVSSGIDMALALAARTHGPEVAQAIQLGIEYDPEPPFDAGSVKTAAPAVVERVRALLASRA